MRELPSRKPALRLGPLYNFRCSTVRLVHLASEPLDEFLAAPGYRRGANYFIKLEDSIMNTQAEIERASANRRIAQPRSATATLIIERRSQHFPDPARGPLKTGRPRHAPTDYPVPRGDCSYIDKSDARAQLWLSLTSAFLPLRLVYQITRTNRQSAC
ncbi:MAG TPA: hypothetical protein VGD36_08145 [Xanthobacteraceae bacterium]